MKIPMCEHILHPHCLKKWLVDFQKCPVCEANIVKLPPGSEKKLKSIDKGDAVALDMAPAKEDEENKNAAAENDLDSHNRQEEDQ